MLAKDCKNMTYITGILGEILVGRVTSYDAVSCCHDPTDYQVKRNKVFNK